MGGGQGLSESVKKGKFVTKIFFADIVEWSSKNFTKIIPADVKKLIKTKRNKTKRSGGSIVQFF